MKQGSKGTRYLLVLSLCLLSGCGYSLRHRLKDSFTRPGKIFVPVFKNSTDEVGAEQVFTTALIRELQSRGEEVLTESKAGAYELSGNLTYITYPSNALSPNGFLGLQGYRRLPTDLQVSAGVSLTLYDPVDRKVLWSRTFSSFRNIAAPAGVDPPTNRTYDYEAPSSLGLYTQSLIESTFPAIARDITRDMYDEMVELF